MGYMYIDDMKVEFENEKNILEVTRRIGIEPVSYTHLRGEQGAL